MARQNINILDFEMFYEIVKSLAKMADGVKFTFDKDGLVVNAKNEYSKCNLTSNSASSNETVEFSIGELQMLLKILGTVKDMYNGDYSSVRMAYDSPFLRIESGKFKTKISTREEEKILKFVSTKIKTELSPLVEFTTSTNMIKTVNSHSFIFPNMSSARLYLREEPDMQKNTMFVTIGNEGDELANSVTLELGLINSGSLTSDDGTVQKVILDFNRLNILNMVPSDEIKVMIAKERPVLLSSVTKEGKNGSFFSIKICSFMMVR